MSDKLDMIYESIQELQQITRSIQNRQEDINAKIDSLILHIAHMQSDRTRMQGDMTEMKEELVSVKGLVKNHDVLLEQLLKSQVRQEKILERLSIRSIEQESEIFTLRGLYQ